MSFRMTGCGCPLVPAIRCAREWRSIALARLHQARVALTRLGTPERLYDRGNALAGRRPCRHPRQLRQGRRALYRRQPITLRLDLATIGSFAAADMGPRGFRPP
jgi:hypothetical protein